jgi:hypothetical protein
VNHRARAAAGIAACLCLALGVARSAGAQPAAPAAKTTRKEAVVAKRAAGSFDVKLKPQSSDADPLGSTLARMSIDKQFHGDLEATSKGEMLSAGTQVEGSAGYVAIERVSGTLHGRRGTFVLQHSGTMTQGAPQLVVSVVPDSGTGELVGLVGAMQIDLATGKHSYVFEYTLPAVRT